MAELQNVVLGFDPGGLGGDRKGKFGWAICAIDGDEFRVFETGRAIHAHDALAGIESKLPADARVHASGIDAPLYWANTGIRRVDCIIKKAGQRNQCPHKDHRPRRDKEGKLKKPAEAIKSGCPYPLSVQKVNSLQGACLAQGALMASLLRGHARFNAQITESHPKALLCLLGLCRIDLAEKVRNTAAIKPPYKEDKEDAVLGAYAAWCMLKESWSPTEAPGWRNILEDEACGNIFFPFHTTIDGSEDPLPVSYWMPISKC